MKTYSRPAFFVSHFRIAAFPFFLLVGCGAQQSSSSSESVGATEFPPQIQQKSSEAKHLAFGITQASELSGLNDVRIVDDALAISYNCKSNIANWAAWSLDAADMSSADRSDFKADTRLPKGCAPISPVMYSGSGYDRGHLVPSADRTKTPIFNALVFTMANIAPQAAKLNRNLWRQLEQEVRTQTQDHMRSLNIVGTLGSKGNIPGTQISIPEYFWRVTLVEKKEGDQKDTSHWENFAVMIPNQDEGLKSSWKDYKLSVRNLESKTGINFNPGMEDNLEKNLEE